MEKARGLQSLGLGDFGMILEFTKVVWQLVDNNCNSNAPVDMIGAMDFTVQAKEAFMSTLHTQPSPIAEFFHKVPRTVDREELLNAVDAGGSDEPMMYPWSIGTTRAAKEWISPRRKEECPPEVYIG